MPAKAAPAVGHTAAPAADSERPSSTVSGPLIVFTDVLAPEQAIVYDDFIDPRAARRVYVYDAATARYWSVLDLTPTASHVELLGTQLLIWRDGQVRLVGLDGTVRAVLLEHGDIRAVAGSPDGLKVAIAYGNPLAVVVFDIAAGAKILNVVAGADPTGCTRRR